jgi:hypothetical protein
MSIPLVMLGPGGDFTTTLNVRGRGLSRQTGPITGGRGHDPQGDSAGGYAQWGRWRKPKGHTSAQAEPEQAAGDWNFSGARCGHSPVARR